MAVLSGLRSVPGVTFGAETVQSEAISHVLNGTSLRLSHSFQAIIRKPPTLSRFWAQGPPWGQNSAGPPDQYHAHEEKAGEERLVGVGSSVGVGVTSQKGVTSVGEGESEKW